MVRNKERCYLAETLYAMYNDTKNYALMSALRSVLIEVQLVNKLFESNNADPTRLYFELNKLLECLISKIKLPHVKIDLMEGKIEDFIDRRCYLGYSFENTISNMIELNTISQEEETGLRDRFISFIISLINQIRKRFPDNYKTLKDITVLSVQNALKHDKPKLLTLLKLLYKNEIDIDDIERQWMNIHLFKWNETKDTNIFWCEVYVYKNANGDNPFLKLSKFAIEMLVLPYSNAEVERLFSKLNIIKNKLRNRLKSDSVKAMLYIRCGLNRLNKCCNDYEIPKEVLDKIKSKETYMDTDLIPSIMEEAYLDLNQCWD